MTPVEVFGCETQVEQRETDVLSQTRTKTNSAFFSVSVTSLVQSGVVSELSDTILCDAFENRFWFGFESVQHAWPIQSRQGSPGRQGTRQEQNINLPQNVCGSHQSRDTFVLQTLLVSTINSGNSDIEILHPV